MKKAIIACILVLILVLTGCKVPEEEVNETVEEGPEVAAEEKELVSNLKCENGVISGTITNTGDSTIDLTKDIRIIIRGLVVANKLLVCEKTTLKPGESTSCSKLNGVYQIRLEGLVAGSVGGNQGAGAWTG